MLSYSLLDYVGNMLQRRRKLFHLVKAKSNVVSDVALVTTHLKCFAELIFSQFELFFFVQDATLSDYSFCTIR